MGSRELREIVQDFLNNEECSCATTESHPCPRCQVTIDEARTELLAAAPQATPQGIPYDILEHDYRLKHGLPIESIAPQASEAEQHRNECENCGRSMVGENAVCLTCWNRVAAPRPAASAEEVREVVVYIERIFEMYDDGDYPQDWKRAREGLKLLAQRTDVPCPENERSATTAEESGIRSAGNSQPDKEAKAK